MNHKLRCVAILGALLALGQCTSARAGIMNLNAGETNLEFVTVGNPGAGQVDQAYQMGKFEVTAGQYCAFLNAVAKNGDAHGLYNLSMAEAAYPTRGCNIVRTGPSSNYAYTVASDWANRPVNYVSWADAARFCNWLQNGQPTGVQGNTTTEDGAYSLQGAALMSVSRNAGAKYFLPSDNEWCKAAYYNGATASYSLYPTGSNLTPSNALSATGENNVNYKLGGVYTDGTHYRTEVGAFAASDSYYGTFDQGGNVWEWTEDIHSPTERTQRGGSFLSTDASVLRADQTSYSTPDYDGYNTLGFRVAAAVPEPGSIALLFVAGAAWFLYRRKAK